MVQFEMSCKYNAKEKKKTTTKINQTYITSMSLYQLLTTTCHDMQNTENFKGNFDPQQYSSNNIENKIQLR